VRDSQGKVPGSEDAECIVGNLTNALRAAIRLDRSRLTLWSRVPAKFRGDDDVALKGFQRFPDQEFVGEGPVHFRRIEEIDAA